MTTAMVARLDSLGDVLITGPAVRAVSAHHDRVVFLAGPRGSAAARMLPGVDRVIEWAAGWVDFDAAPVTADAVTALTDEITDEKPDAVLIFTSFHQSPLPLALICRMAGVPWIGAICEDYPGRLLDLRHRVDNDVAEPLRALSLAAAAGWPLPADDDAGLQITHPAALPPDVAAALRGRDYVVFHPAAAVPARQPSSAKSTEIVRALVAAGYDVVVTGSEADRELTATVASGIAVDLGGRTTLAQLATVFTGARAVVAPNTGPAHLAAAVRAPIVSLFAPVVPAARWLPYGTVVTVLGDQNAACRNTRARDCPVPGHPCLNDIAAGDVVAAVTGLTNRGAA